MPHIPTAKPVVKKISARGLTFALDGPERAYPVYQFSDVYKYERPNSKYPFAVPIDVRITEDGDDRHTEADDTRIVTE